MSASRPNIAVLGTGSMGAPIARNLLAAGFPVTVWNRTRARAEALADDGAVIASAPAEAAEHAEVLLTMLADGDAVREAMEGPRGALATLRRGAIWIQMATVGLDWIERLAALALEHEVELVDAPVSGSVGPATEGTLVVLASGPTGLQPVVGPVFDAIGSQTLWAGPAGYGTRLKLVFNNWLVSQVEALAETVALAEAFGLDAGDFIETMGRGPLGSPYAVAKGREMITGELAPGFALKLAYKDAALALAGARGFGVTLAVTEALEPRWREAIADGHGDADVAAVIDVARRKP
jgi:3-hydroxyisobutyrate dehydrogenase